MDKDYDLLKKAKRAVWLNRWFGFSIPEEYEKLIIEQKCCSETFMVRYVTNHCLLRPNEDILVDKYIDSNPELIIKYLHCHGVLNVDAQIKIIEHKNLDLVVKMIEYFDENKPYIISRPQVKALINLNDPCFFYDSLCHAKNIEIDDSVVFDILASKNIETFKIYLTLKDMEIIKFNTVSEQSIFKEGTPEMIDYYLKKRIPFDRTLIELLRPSIVNSTTGQKIDYTPIFATLIGNEREFSDNVLLAMVDAGAKDLLKLYYSMHGLSPQVLAYYNDLHNFKQDVGLLES